MQTDVAVTGNAITGTLKYLSTGALVTDWGAGNFLALKFEDIDDRAVSVKVGLDPSQSTGLVELINDPDKNGVFKITATTQKFKVISRDADGNETTQTFDLSGLTLQGAGV